jgi:flavin-binding protein dodecin
MVSVARVTEISAISDTSFEDAIRGGIRRASETLRGLKSAVVKEQEVLLREDGAISGFKVNLLVSFILEELVSELSPYPDPATQTADFAVFDEEPSP